MQNIPDWLKRNDIDFDESFELPKALLSEVRKRFTRFQTSRPLVSIIVYVPSTNLNLFSTLSSLADLHSPSPTELLFVCHSSNSETIDILQKINAAYLSGDFHSEAEARQAALLQAKGAYVLNADANTIYPPKWGKRLVDMLLKKEAACVYGSIICFNRFHFYGTLGALQNWWQHRKNPEWSAQEESIPSFNFAFKKDDALAIIGGFDTSAPDRPASRLASELMKYGPVLKDIHPDSSVWHRMQLGNRKRIISQAVLPV